jgi:hypothetical protein
MTITILHMAALFGLLRKSARFAEMQSVDLPAVRTLQSTRKNIASTTAFRSRLPCQLRELDQHHRSDDPAPMFFQAEKPLACNHDGSPKRHVGVG